MTQTTLFGLPVSASKDEWYTPRWVFEAAGITFDMDVCAPIDPTQRTCPARRYLTIQDDGLTAEWDGVIWCNPPYSNTAPWAYRWAEHPTGMLLAPVTSHSRWRGAAIAAADTFAAIDCRFGRPTNLVEKISSALMIVSRGALISCVHRACGNCG